VEVEVVLISLSVTFQSLEVEWQAAVTIHLLDVLRFPGGGVAIGPHNGAFHPISHFNLRLREVIDIERGHRIQPFS
jgi:hypothetical protein